MKPLKKTLPFLALTLSAILVIIGIACNKGVSSGNTSTTNNNIPPDATVNASIQGRVVDQDGVPVQGAAVTSGQSSTTTDVNGVFSFSNISMSSRFGYVQATKSGYFTGSRSIITNGGASNFVSIQLVPRSETGSFSATSGGNIAIQAGDTAAFSANSVVTASTNAVYTGTVHVFANYLDPSDPNYYKYMPGDLRGIGTDGKETALQTFGMLDVELRDDAGNRLQIASGQKATLTWAIPTTLQTAAPATIPLWYFNDSTGRWIQQGTAIRTGASYIGQVSHFTWWNVDRPIATVNFTGNLKDNYGNPLAYTRVYFTYPDMPLYVTNVYSDSAGNIKGLIAEGETAVMQIVTQCGTVLAGANVGPALSDQNLGTIKVNVSYSDLTITGKVTNCSGAAVDNGYVGVKVDGLSYRAVVAKGSFTLPVARCYNSTTTVTVQAYDLATMQQSNTVSFSAASGTADAGTISVCSVAYNVYLTWTYQGVTQTFVSPPDDVSAGIIQGNILNLDGSVLNSDGTNAINSSISIPNFSGPGTYKSDGFVYMKVGGPNIFYAIGGDFNITDTSGGYITGTIGGSMSPADSAGIVYYPISGSFRIPRVY